MLVRGILVEVMDLGAVRSISEVLALAASTLPEQVALKTADRTHTFRSLDTTANRVGHALIDAGVSAQQQVGFLGCNSAASVELMFGAFRANAIWTPLNWRLPRDVLQRIVGKTNIRILFADEALAGGSGVLINRAGETVRTILVGGPRAEYPSWCEAHSAHSPAVVLGGEDIAAQIYTSGTSGVPKGVMLSHGALLASRRIERQVGEPWSDWRPGEVNLVCMPNFHVSGTLSVIAGVVNLGRTILLPQFEVEAVLDVLRRDPPMRLLLVPSAIKLLLDDPRSRDIDFSRVKYVMYGGSPMPMPLMREILGRMNCEFVQFYGMTETSGRATYLPPADHGSGGSRKLASAGRPFPGVSLAIRNEQGESLPVGEIGEICIKSPSVMSGYWADPEASASALQDGWYRTGDVGHLDADGYLFVVDRLNDKIVTGGENVYPSEVESALRSHPLVMDAAVCALPDPRWIEAIYAAVISKPGTTAAATEAELRAWVSERIGSYKAPKRVVFVDRFPRGATGKVLRKDLAEQVKGLLPS
jgi:acyl-CoA synthetase (AMP-forming)/AMP-acid ligase II